MRLPRRAPRSVYAVCDAEEALGAEGEDCEPRFGEADLPGVETGRRSSVERSHHSTVDGSLHSTVEGPRHRRGPRVLGVVLLAAAACVAIALAFALLRPVGAGRLQGGSAEGVSRRTESNVVAGRSTSIDRQMRISRRARAPRRAVRVRARWACRCGGPGVEARSRHGRGRLEASPTRARAISTLGARPPVVLAEEGRPSESPALVTEAEFGFER
jgi:hypothetical protein